MVVLSYDSAKRSLLFTALYLVLASIIFKGLAHVIEINLIGSFTSLDSLLNFTDWNIELPQFDFSTWSFEGIKIYLSDKITDLVNMLIPGMIGVANAAVVSGSTPTVFHMDKTMMVVKI